MLEQLENSTVYNPAVEGSKDSAQIERESASFDADEDHLTAETGLSDETLQLLLQFQSLGCRFVDDINDGTKDVITSKTVCVSYTARDSQVIAETYRRLQEKAENAAQDYASQLESRVIQDLQGFDCINSCAPQRLKEDMFGALQRDGVVRLNHVLDADSCERCLESINRSLEEVDSSDTIGFGNVFSRKCRYDMYLRPQGVYREALQTLLSSKHSALGALLDRCLSVSNQGEAHIGQNVPCNFGRFHELSTLIADPGAAPQPIHPDAGYAPHAPMWTCFVALQDISPEMGPTVFLPGTHTETSHALLKDPARKDAFLSGCTYKQGLLRAGDAAVMDARTLHFGNANESKHRRTLFYFTIRNPAHGSDPSDFPPCGSLFEDVEGLTIESLRNENGGKLLLDKQ